jgi:ribonuclease P protein component
MMTLRQRHEFEAVLTSPRKAIVSSLFVVRHLAKLAGPARLGIIASRRALGKAVDRNRAKRLIREAFRASHRELATMDLVVQVRGALAHAPAAAARRDLAAIFGRITRG